MTYRWPKFLLLGFFALLCLLAWQEQSFVSAQRQTKRPAQVKQPVGPSQAKRGQKATTTSPLPQVQARNLYALVIGANKYQNQPAWKELPGVKTDLQLVGSLLISLGFKVKIIEDPNKKTLEDSINQFIDDYGYELENRLLIYFAGHGTTLEVNGNDLGYIVPVDAPDPNKDRIGFLRKAVSMSEISGFARKMQCRHALFIFDSCFSGSIFDIRGATSPPAPAPIEAKLNRVVRQFITSGSRNQTVPDESRFQKYLLLAFEQRAADKNEDGYITGSELGDYLSEHVTNESSGTQTPQYAKLNDVNYNQGDFVFKLPALPEAPKPEPPTVKAILPSPAELEKQAYESVRGSNDPELMREFLKEFPKSNYAPVLRIEIRRIEIRRIEVERKREQERLAALAKENAKPSAPEILPPPAPLVLPSIRTRFPALILHRPSLLAAPRWTFHLVEALPPPQKLLSAPAKRPALVLNPPKTATAPSGLIVLAEVSAAPPPKPVITKEERPRLSTPTPAPTETATTAPATIEPERPKPLVPAPSKPVPALKSGTLSFTTAMAKSNGKLDNNTKAARTAETVSIEIAKGISIELVNIPVGNFMMGSLDNEPGRSSSEGPLHRVYVSSFWMGRFEITQEQWHAVATALPKVKYDLPPDPSTFKGRNLPVENISWIAAIEFCLRLSQKTGLELRLPYEAEWEYACRAGTATPFYYGATISDEIVNYDGTQPLGNAGKGKYRRSTVPVGSLGVANAFGLSEMHGNVWEWCLDDWRENYRGLSEETTTLLGSSPDRVIRGGAWFAPALECRATQRKARRINEGGQDVGLRIVMVSTKGQ